MTKYQEKKEKARQQAIEWQYRLSSELLSYDTLSTMQEKFEHLGRRYGLVREFKENAII